MHYLILLFTGFPPQKNDLQPAETLALTRLCTLEFLEKTTSLKTHEDQVLEDFSLVSDLAIYSAV